VKVLAPHLGSLQSAGGGSVGVDELIVTMPSVMFDAVFIPGGRASVAALKVYGNAVHFVSEAYKHSKAIAAFGEGRELLAAAGALGTQRSSGAAAGVSVADDAAVLARTFISDISVHRHWERATQATPA
jgi:catalase